MEPATVARDLGLHLMRFVMMENTLPQAEVLEFLQNLASALAMFVAELERYPAVTGPGHRHPRLALDHGLAVYRVSLPWAEDTLAHSRSSRTLPVQLRHQSGHATMARRKLPGALTHSWPAAVRFCCACHFAR